MLGLVNKTKRFRLCRSPLLPRILLLVQAHYAEMLVYQVSCAFSFLLFGDLYLAVYILVFTAVLGIIYVGFGSISALALYFAISRFE